jgi:hypothetical protein
MMLPVKNSQKHLRVFSVTSMQVHSLDAVPNGHRGWEQMCVPALRVGFCTTPMQVWAITPTKTHVVSGTAKSLYSERCLT